MPPSVTTPLLPTASPAVLAAPAEPTTPAEPPPLSLTRPQHIAVKTFSVLRFLRGLILLTYPQAGLWALAVPSSSATFMLASLIGVRDMLIAGLLFTAPAASRMEVSRALVLNLLSDAVDAFVLVFYSTFSKRWENPLAVIIVTAVMAIAEHLTLWSMSEAEAGGRAEARPSIQEVKATRMTAWLRDLRQFGSSRPGSSRNSVRQGGETPV